MDKSFAHDRGLQMNIRSSSKQVTFAHPFTMPGFTEPLPAGHYDILIEEELLQGLSFEAYRRISTHMMVTGQTGRVEMCPIMEKDLETAINRDLAVLDQGAPQNDR